MNTNKIEEITLTFFKTLNMTSPSNLKTRLLSAREMIKIFPIQLEKNINEKYPVIKGCLVKSKLNENAYDLYLNNSVKSEKFKEFVLIHELSHYIQLPIYSNNLLSGNTYADIGMLFFNEYAACFLCNSIYSQKIKKINFDSYVKQICDEKYFDSFLYNSTASSFADLIAKLALCNPNTIKRLRKKYSHIDKIYKNIDYLNKLLKKKKVISEYQAKKVFKCFLFS